MNQEWGHYREITDQNQNNDCTDEVNKLFIIRPFHWQWQLWTWTCNQLKPITGLNELNTWAHDTVMWHWSADTLFDSCQLTITWMSIRMSTIKLITDCICLGHLACNARSLQEDLARLATNQSVRTIVALIIIVLYCFFVLDESLKFVIASFWAGQSFALLLCLKKYKLELEETLAARRTMSMCHLTHHPPFVWLPLPPPPWFV